jgi:hypothetical protein
VLNKFKFPEFNEKLKLKVNPHEAQPGYFWAGFAPRSEKSPATPSQILLKRLLPFLGRGL